MKIDINIKNDKHFLDIATLIDQPDFIQWVEKLRKKWNLTKRYKTGEYKEFYGFIWGQNEEENRWNNFLKDVQRMRTAFKKSLNFDTVIIYAIAFNQIPSHAYKTCYIRAEPLDPSEAGSDEYSFSIVISTETTRDEILKEFSKFKNGLAGKMDPQLEGYEWDVFPTEKIRDHKAGNIKRDRDWYWLKTNEGMSYNDILKQEIRNGNNLIDRDLIVKAIKTYKNRLK